MKLDPNVHDILQHLGEDVHHCGAVAPPIFQTSLFVHENCESFKRASDPLTPDETGYVYSRLANPTLTVAEKKIAALEHTECCKLFSSGMSAISAGIMSAVHAGCHAICTDTAYGPTRDFMTNYLKRFGVETTLVDATNADEILGSVRPNTSLIFLESPGSIIFQVSDLEAIGTFAREKGITTAIDNTYASPLFQNPADFGIDLVIHSATKYIAGHSDVIAGAVCASRERMCKMTLGGEVEHFGGALAPFPAWLLLRGMRTLAIRMQAAEETGNVLYRELKTRPWIEEVFHVGAPDHPQAALVSKQMSGTGSLLSFVPKFQTEEEIMKFMDRCQVFQRGVSWGGFESLIVALPIECRAWKSKRWVVRIYGGLESHESMLHDLDQAATGLG